MPRRPPGGEDPGQLILVKQVARPSLVPECLASLRPGTEQPLFVGGLDELTAGFVPPGPAGIGEFVLLRSGAALEKGTGGCRVTLGQEAQVARIHR